MFLTKSVLRFGFVCSILFVLDGAKVNHIAHTRKVIGINEIEVCRNHFDNFNNHCFLQPFHQKSPQMKKDNVSHHLLYIQQS